MCYILGGCLQSSCIKLLYFNSENMKILKRKDGTAAVTIKKKAREGELSRALGFPTKETGPVGFFQPLRCWRFPLGKCLDHCW